ncbi:MAG: bifunctional diguanylate cyclase/phosphodiesterase [Betaproteobacteria bacterium]|nr:bifunctional diguanylate cyclase/phosphodiesterase [Betaproteobacteria bacterium]
MLQESQAQVSTALENTRLYVVERVASLMESQVRSQLFTENVGELVKSINQELSDHLTDALDLLGRVSLSAEDRAAIATRLFSGRARSNRLERALSILLQERQRQWTKNVEQLHQVALEFNQTVEGFKTFLVEKDLLERQSRILETIVLSHEKVSQWKAFVQEILTGFHSIFPFNFFFIAFVEGKGVSLLLYYLGEYSDELRRMARTKLSHELIEQLHLPIDAPLDIEEFHIPIVHPIPLSLEQEVEMITVSVPDLEMPNLGGVLGMAFGSSKKLTAQEESVIRSTLAVMVMVVGSSKTLSRTLSELEYYSTHDPLTGLHNRRYFEELLQYEEGRSERHNHQFSVLMIDLDDFKDVNDTYGHPCGDSVLKQVAEVIIHSMRKGDIATRIGGDEFAIILTETGKVGGVSVAEKLRLALREMPFISPDGKAFHITISIGIVTFPDDGEKVADLMTGVDVGLYRAKQMGKDGIGTIHSPGELQAGRTIRDNAEKLRQALKDNRIIPYYQPIFDIQTGTVVAFETLARLKELDGTTHSAGTFIETIEKYGLGRDLDRVILEKAFNAIHTFRENGLSMPRLFLNLSAQEVQGRGILGFAEQLCRELAIPPALVVFEILERDAIGDMTNMRKFLANLRDKGFSFALDDFGSGYNSFHYLRELRFDFVKLDGAFVRNILNSKVDYILIKNLNLLCQELGILTVAEFVESREVLMALMDMGINYAQGYHLGLPTNKMLFPSERPAFVGRKKLG